MWFIVFFGVVFIVVSFIGGNKVFRTVMDRNLLLPTKEDDLDDPNNLLAPTTRQRVAYKEGKAGYFNSLPFEDLYIQSFDGLKLHGMFIKGEDPSLTAILVHGYKASPEGDFDGIIKLYMDRKCNILCVEDRSHGQSEGRWLGFSELDQYDVISWTEKINEMYPDTNIFLHGVSMGGATVVHTCNKEMKNVKGIVDDCGFTSIRDITKHLMKRVFNVSYFPFGYTAGIISIFVAHVNFDKSNGVKEVAQSKYPMLFIHGSEDKFVPCYMGKNMYEACTSEKDIFIVEGAGHAASQILDEEGYFNKVNNFIDKYK